VGTHFVLESDWKLMAKLSTKENIKHTLDVQRAPQNFASQATHMMYIHSSKAWPMQVIELKGGSRYLFMRLWYM